MLSIWIGFDGREASAFAVCRKTIQSQINLPIPVYGIVLDELIKRGLYWRKTERRLGRLWDCISEAPMSTEFAISRFLVPYLAKEGWALFMDCDMLVRTDLAVLFEGLDSSKAVYCVKHNHVPEKGTKMDDQEQTRYARKNWSSFMLFNCDHESNKKLTPELVNSLPGRDLHRFCWLNDDEIGELGPEWNYLVGHTDKNVIPKVVHFTDGGPWFTAFENVPYAEEWKAALNWWAAR